MFESIIFIALLFSTFVGAGISSGKEVYEYFFRFGILGVINIVLMGVLIGWFLQKIFAIKRQLNVGSYYELNKILFPVSNRVTLSGYNISLVISIFSMMSGCRSLFSSILPQVPSFLVVIVLCVLSCVVLHYGVRALLKCGFFIALLMLLLIICNSGLSIKMDTVQTIYGGSIGISIIYMCLFAFGNLALFLEILLSTHVPKHKPVMIVLSIMIPVLLLLIFVSLTKVNIDLGHADMPTLVLANQVSKVWYYTYVFAIFLAMFSTLISVQFTLKNNLSKIIKTKKLDILIILISLCGAFIPFDALVRYGYAVTGAIGTVTCLRILTYKTVHKSCKLSSLCVDSR